MAKRKLTPVEAFDLRQALHVAVLDALMVSRRWEPGHLVFQGGTSLHLAHGSPRYSEDLDFLVDSSLKLDAISGTMGDRLKSMPWLPEDMILTVKKAEDGRNPHAFVVTIGGDNVIGAVRVKVELWKTEQKAISSINAVVAPVRLSSRLASGMQTFVPTADVSEIYADKVFALVARPYLKPRDVFDLHWLSAHTGIAQCTVEDMRVRLATYPNETPAAWLAKAADRRSLLPLSVRAITNDLRTWLPPSWALNEPAVMEFVATSVAALDHGVDLMREIMVERSESVTNPAHNDGYSELLP